MTDTPAPASPVAARLLQTNMGFLGALGILFALGQVIIGFKDLVTLGGGVVLMGYLLLGPVNTVERLLKHLLKPVHARLRTKLFRRVRLPLRGLLTPRWMAVLLVYISFLAGLMGVAGAVLPQLQRQIKDLASDLPEYAQSLERSFDAFRWPPGNPSAIMQQTLGLSTPSPSGKVLSANAATGEAKGGILRGLVHYLQTHVSQTLHHVWDVVLHSVLGVLHTVAAVVLVFFLLLDGHRLRSAVERLTPAAWSPGLLHWAEQVHKVLLTLMKTQTVMAVLSATAMLGVYELLGMKYSLFLSMVYGVASLLPVLGPWLGWLPGALLLGLLAPERLPWLALLSFGLYVLKEHWFLPRLEDHTVREVHPVIILVSLLVCLRLAGLAGMVLIFPIAAVLCVTLQNLGEYRSKALDGRAPAGELS